jgi:hypothetical protein
MIYDKCIVYVSYIIVTGCGISEHAGLGVGDLCPRPGPPQPDGRRAGVGHERSSWLFLAIMRIELVFFMCGGTPRSMYDDQHEHDCDNNRHGYQIWALIHSGLLIIGVIVTVPTIRRVLSLRSGHSCACPHLRRRLRECRAKSSRGCSLEAIGP